MESKLAATLILSVLLASWILDCKGFAGPFPTDGKRLLRKTGNLYRLRETDNKLRTQALKIPTRISYRV